MVVSVRFQCAAARPSKRTCGGCKIANGHGEDLVLVMMLLTSIASFSDSLRGP